MLKQHKDSYRSALLDLIENNSDSLVNQDLVSVLGKPPLDSMDLLRTKMLDLAKKNKVVLNAEKLDLMLEKYRSQLLNVCKKIKELRVSELSLIVKKDKLDDRTLIMINKKDLSNINKKIKDILKESMTDGFQKRILNQLRSIFVETVEDSIYEKYVQDFTKYVKGTYQKQILESCELKIMVKDTILMNGMKEHGERYLFALDHSRLFHEVDA